MTGGAALDDPASRVTLGAGGFADLLKVGVMLFAAESGMSCGGKILRPVERPLALGRGGGA